MHDGNKTVSAHVVFRPLLWKQGSISSDIKSNIYGLHGYYIKILAHFREKSNMIVFISPWWRNLCCQNDDAWILILALFAVLQQFYTPS